MTPKDKATELVDKFENVENYFDGDCFWLTRKTSKQCALISLDEQISILMQLEETFMSKFLIKSAMDIHNKIKELRELKTEIENL